MTVNPEYVVAARRNPRFRAVLNSADLALADGVGILWAARLLRKPAPDRITGNDLVEAVAAMEHENKRIFLLGAAEGVAEEAALVLRRRHPSAGIVGTFSGDSHPSGWDEIASALAAAKPTVLFVAFGHPRQDLWIAANRERLESHGILVASGVGGVYVYLSGRVTRAPGILRRLGLEWLYRLVRQPWRWRRQTVLPVFVLLVIVEAIRARSGVNRL
ncbi:MAG: WecB/TagA/CpsF family glycosyltransferase [Thermomicrobiales bacterium]